MIFDTHMHAKNSHDGMQTYADIQKRQAELGIGVVITEHWDYDYPTVPEEFVYDLDAYFKTLNPLRSSKFLIGIEVGMQESIIADNDRILKKHNFDMIIGAMHLMNRKDIYNLDIYKGRTKADLLKEYLEASIINIRAFENFDTFAHVDYICRKWPFLDPEFHYEENPALWDEFFKALIDCEKAIEINTRRLSNPKAVEALTALYTKAHEKGIVYCTIGSDAHYREHVGRDLDVALKIAKDAGLKVVYFKERKMIEINV